MSEKDFIITKTETIYGLYGEPVGKYTMEIDLRNPEYHKQVLAASKFIAATTKKGKTNENSAGGS